MRRTLASTAVLVAAAGGIALMVPSHDAKAAAYAYSALEIQDFTATNEFGGFSTFNFVGKFNSVFLNGATDTTGPVTETGSGSTVNLPQVCVGDCGSFVEDTFFPEPAPFANGDFAVADQFLTDSVVLDADGGDWGSMSGVQLGAGTAVAESGTDHQLQWDFNISDAELAAAGGTIDIAFEFLRNHVLQLATTEAGDTANATMGFTIGISGPENFEETIFDFSEEISALQSPDTLTLSSGGFVTDSATASLSTAGNYSMLFNYDTAANATAAEAVPEPSTLAVLGAALLGIGVAGRRKLGRR